MIPPLAMSASRVHHAAVYRRAAILLCLCAVLAGVASSGALHETLLTVLVATEGLIGQHVLLGLAAFVLLAAVSAMFTFMSIAIVVPAAVFAWGAPASIALLWIGWILGGLATYTIGRYFGRPIVRSLTTSQALHKLETRLPPDAPLSLIVLVQLALPSELPGYVLGLARYPFVRYAVALSIAELPYTFATVYLGSSFVEGRGAVILMIAALIALFSLAAFHAVSGSLRERIAPENPRA